MIPFLQNGVGLPCINIFVVVVVVVVVVVQILDNLAISLYEIDRMFIFFNGKLLKDVSKSTYFNTKHLISPFRTSEPMTRSKLLLGISISAKLDMKLLSGCDDFYGYLPLSLSFDTNQQFSVEKTNVSKNKSATL